MTITRERQARFAAEVKEKWGDTAAYREYRKREREGTVGGEGAAEFVQRAIRAYCER